MIDAKQAKKQIQVPEPDLKHVLNDVEMGIQIAVMEGFSRTQIEVPGNKALIDFLIEDLKDLGYRVKLDLRRGLISNGLLVMPSYWLIINWG